MRALAAAVFASTVASWCGPAGAQPEEEAPPPTPTDVDPAPAPADEPAPPPPPPQHATPPAAPEVSAPPESPPPAAAVQAPPSGPTLEVHGYLQVHYRAHLETNGDGATTPDDFRVQRVRLGVEGQLVRHFGYDIELDPRAPEITGILRDAYLWIDVIPHHEVRIGQQKTQFGYENVVSSTRLFVVNRSEVSDNLSRGATLRDIGIGIVGGWPLGGDFRIEDAVTLVNGEGMNVQEDLTQRKNLWGRLGLEYRRKRRGIRVRLGVSGAIGDQREPADPGPPPEEEVLFRFRRLGGDLEVEHPWVSLAAEVVYSRDLMPDETVKTIGYYVTLAGITPWRVGPIVRYDELEEYNRWTLGAFYGLPRDHLRALVNYEIRHDETGNHDHRVYLWGQGRF